MARQQAHLVKAHQPCPDCGSSDALSYYSDGHTFCFSCEKHQNGVGEPDQFLQQPSERLHGDIIPPRGSEYQALPERALRADTATLYGVLKDPNGYTFRYKDADGADVAIKRRTNDKEFHAVGPWEKAVLFGQHLFPKGGKFLTICEGEFDAMAAFEMQGSKYPCVSVRNGATSALKDCRANYEYIDSFEQVIICFDMDEPGRKAAQQVGELFGGKAKIVKMQLKDANEYLKEGRAKDYIEAWWRAEQYVPDGIINMQNLYDEVMADVPPALVMYPWDEWNDLTYGIREEELITLAAGTGLGKTAVLSEIVHHCFKQTPYNIGLLFLEDGRRKTAQRVMSLELNKPIHLPTTVVTPEEKQAAFDATLGTGRLFMFDHFGSTGIDNIVSRVRYMAKALDCKFIFLDHISIIVSAQQEKDERKAIDEIVTKLRMLVQETRIALFIVSHLTRPEGKGHEEGADVSLKQLRGSGAIAQLSDLVVGLKRNGQSQDPKERNTTYSFALKNRFSGQTGPMGSLLYDRHTGRLQQVNYQL